MRAKTGKYRLSPNEEAELIKAETDKRKKLRLLQVREQSRMNAAKIRQAVKQEKERQLIKLASQVENQLEKERQEKLRLLEAQYENSLRTIGQGHKQAGEQHSQEDLRNALMIEDFRRAKKRHKTAVERQQIEDSQKNYEKNRHIIARKAALELEKERALRIASLPPPPPDPLLQLQLNDKKPVKLTDADAFVTTRYHLLDDYGIDRADPRQQGDAKKDAEEEGERIIEKQMELDRIRTEQMERARLRHKHALNKELLKNDYEKMMLELSDMQRADRDRRQKIVADIPKQVFEPPHRRMETAREKQNDMEQAFEDMYMATTDFTGDLSLALDRHPAPETPSVTESLEVSTLTELDSFQEPSLPQVSSVLRDMTNTPKQPEKVLRKLMNKIKSQRSGTMSKSLQDYPELNQPLGEGRKEMLIPVRDDDMPVKDIPVHNSVGDIQKGRRLEPQPWFPAHQNEYSPAEELQAVYDIQPPSYKHIPHSPPEKLDRDDSLLESKANMRSPQIGQNILLHPIEIAEKLRGQLIHGQVSSREPVDNRDEDKNEDKTSEAIGLLLEQQKQIEEQKRLLEEKMQELLQQPHGTITPSSFSTGSSHNVLHLPSVAPPGVAYHTGHQHPVSQSQLGYLPQQAQFLPQNLQQPMMLPVTPAFSFVNESSALPPSQHIVPHIPMAAPVHYSQHPFPKENIPAFAMNGNVAVASSQGQMTWTGVPSPGTVASADNHADHMRKIKEYQHQLLARHEHSKKVLADTRNEIEKRRKELLLKFPQLSSQDESIESIHQQELLSTLQVPTSSFQPGQAFEMPKYPQFVNTASRSQPQPVAQPAEYSTLEINRSQFLDSGPLMNRLMNQLQQVPPSTVVESIPNNNQNVSSISDSIRKSLSFNADDSYMHSPLEPIYSEFRQDLTTPTVKGRKRIVMDEEEMDTTLSSSERGSPYLTSHTNLSSSESEHELSLIRMAKERCETFQMKKQELQSQLEDIEKQKSEILRRHEMSQIRIKTERNRLKSKLIQAVAETQHEMLMEDVHEIDEEYEVSQPELSQEQIEVSLAKKTHPIQPAAHPPPTKPVFIADHVPHELSTIPEVDTPVSARLSGTFLSSRPSLSSSEGSITARSHGSLEFPQSLPVMPEVQYSPEVINKVAADTGYQTSEIEEILKKAKEFDASLMHLLKKQTNDVSKHQEDSDGQMTLSNRSLTSESLSTGPLNSQNVSQAELQSETSFPSSDQGDLFPEIKPGHIPHWVTMLNADDRPSDSSTLSSKSWADEFQPYKNNVEISEPDCHLKVVQQQQQQQDIDQMTRLENAATLDISGNLRSPQSGVHVTDHMTDMKNIPNLSQHRLPDSYPNITKSTDFSPYVVNAKQTNVFAEPIVSNKYGHIDKQLNGFGNDVGLSQVVDVKDASKTDLSRYAKSDDSRTLDTILGTEFLLSGESKTTDLSEYPISEQSETPELSQYPVSNATETPELSQYPLSEDGNLSTPKSTPEQLQPSSGDSDQMFLPLQSDHDESRPADLPVTVQNSVGLVDDLLIDFSTPEVAKKTKSRHEYHIPNSVNVSEAVKFPLDLSKYSFSVDNARIVQSGDARREAQTLPISSSEVSSTLTGSSETSDMTRDSGSFPFLKELEQNMTSITGVSNLNTATTSWATSQTAKTVGVSSFTNSVDAFRGTSLSMATTDFSMSGFSKLHTISDPSNLTELSEDNSLSDHSLQDDKLGYLVKKTSHTMSEAEPVETSILSQYSIVSEVDTEDDSYVDKKFANLDKLLQESKDLIARHRDVVDKNKKRELKESKKNEGILSESEEKSSLAEQILSSAQRQLDLYSCDTQTGSPGLSDNMADLMNFDDDSLDFAGKQQSMDLSEGPLSSFSLSQIIENETGISDEPDLTLVTFDSEISLNEETNKSTEPVSKGNVHSSGSCGNSLLSFEDHERDLDSVDLGSSTEVRQSPSDAGNSMEEAVAKPRNSNNSAIEPSKRGQSRTTVYRAVPVLIDVPRLSMTMQADSEPKSPPEKPTEIDIKKPSNDEPASWTSVSDKAYSPCVPGSPTRIANFKELNKALQPRMSGRGMAGLGMTRHTDFGQKIKKFESSLPSSPAEMPKGTPVDSVPTKSTVVAPVDSAPKKSTVAAPVDSAPKKSTVAAPVDSAPKKSTVVAPVDSAPKKSTVAAPVDSAHMKSAVTAPVNSAHMKSAVAAPVDSASMKSAVTAPAARKSTTGTSGGISKTLSSWKKSRSIKKADPPSVPPKNLRNAVRVLPSNPPPARQSSEESDAGKNEAYEKKMRAYNPRLFRLCNRFDDGEEKNEKADKTEKQIQIAANREKVKDFQKKLQETMKRKQQKEKK